MPEHETLRGRQLLINLLHTDGQPINYSHSTLQNYAQCPARLYFKKLIREGIIPVDEESISLPAVFGSAAHKGIEERLKHGTDPVEAASVYLQKNLFDKYAGVKLDPFKAQIEDRRLHMYRCLDNFEKEFYPTLADTVKPENVEVRVEAPFRKGKLVGVIDLIHTPENGTGETFFADWKTGEKVPGYATLYGSPQGGFYVLMAKQSNGLVPVPKQFVYVYLAGKNQARVATKTGRKVGQPRADTKNPQYQYSFQVTWDDARLESLQRNYLEPLASAYETGIVFKNKSDFNCNTCQYREICDKTDLPKVTPPNNVIDLLSA